MLISAPTISVIIFPVTTFPGKFTMLMLFRILPYICNVHVKIVPYSSVKHIFLFSLFFCIAEVNSLPINFGQERKRLHPSNAVSQAAVVALGSIRYPTFTCKCSGSGYRILSGEKTLANFKGFVTTNESFFAKFGGMASVCRISEQSMKVFSIQIHKSSLP